MTRLHIIKLRDKNGLGGSGDGSVHLPDERYDLDTGRSHLGLSKPADWQRVERVYDDKRDGNPHGGTNARYPVSDED